ncbi:hypothetical protein [Stutzerimonas degradans]|uniref:hypothetical protein n=1 Tax=Stutzerimonas degradans TaxID=2968968 RepID=UPI0013F4E2D6|nr:hypothetical protein [Stutzerimonas degradans]NHC09800.1 hypothetical protein [Stutzerimonas degradans]
MTPNTAYWTSMLSPILVIVGWYIVYYNSNRVAKRSEAYNLVSKTIEKVLSLDTRCADYWLSSKEQQPQKWLAGTLAEIHGIRTLLEMLEEHHNFKEKNDILVRLRMAATLNAEKVASMSTPELKSKKQDQSAAMNSTVKSLYNYYRSLNA